MKEWSVARERKWFESLACEIFVRMIINVEGIFWYAASSAVARDRRDVMSDWWSGHLQLASPGFRCPEMSIWGLRNVIGEWFAFLSWWEMWMWNEVHFDDYPYRQSAKRSSPCVSRSLLMVVCKAHIHKAELLSTEADMSWRAAQSPSSLI